MMYNELTSFGGDSVFFFPKEACFGLLVQVLVFSFICTFTFGNIEKSVFIDKIRT